MKITNKAQLQKAVAEFDASTSPFAHVGIIQKAATDLGLENELPAEGPLAIGKQDDTAAELAKAKRDIAILKMNGETRAYFDGLDEAGQTAFLAKSADDQAADVAKANEADPVIYTMSDGTAVRKSAGDLAVSMAKRMDKLESENAELRKGHTESTLETRAAAFPNVAKAVAVDMLKSVDAVGAESEAGKSIMKSLTAMNAQSKGVFKSLGSVETSEVPETLAKARSDFNAEVEKVARENKLTRTDAMSKVRDERPELFKAAYPENADEQGEDA